MTVVANRTPPIMCFCLDITRFFHPLYPLVSAIVPWGFLIVKGNVTKLLHSLDYII